MGGPGIHIDEIFTFLETHSHNDIYIFGFMSLFEYCIIENLFEPLKYILNLPTFDINKTYLSDEYRLVGAFRDCTIEILQLFIQKYPTIDIDARTAVNETALHWAIYKCVFYLNTLKL